MKLDAKQVYHKSIRLGENFYSYVWLGRGNNCNTSLLAGTLRGKKPHVLVDPGQLRNEFGEPCFDSLTQAMKNDGINMEDIGLVIATHSHPDHVDATDLVVKRSGALLTLSREEEEFYQEVRSKYLGALSLKMIETSPYFYLQEGDLSLGAKDKLAIKVLFTPGHSPGSLCLYLEDEKILISGDVVFFGSVGRTDFPGGSSSLLKKSIEKLSQLDVEHLVPGHNTELGSIVSGKDKVERNFQMVKMFS